MYFFPPTISKMKISTIILLISFIYGLIFCLPKKISLLKKYNWDLANLQIMKMAKEGDLEAKKLHRATIISLAIGLFGAAIYVLEQILPLPNE